MIIKEIHIDGFGIFNGFSLTGLNHGVNMILGSNEAGKSSLMKFIRYTLFGYPRAVNDRMPPLEGGAHGGRIKVMLSSGLEAVFERSGKNTIRLHYNGQESNDQNLWSQLLGNASARLYNNVYAFSLDELISLDPLSESGVEDKIFSVGLGLGQTSLGQVEKNIQDGIDEVYKFRGNVQLMPKILSELKNKKLQAQQIQDELPNYIKLSKDIVTVQKKLDFAGPQLDSLREEKVLLENYIKCYDAFIVATQTTGLLLKLPDVRNYPENALALLDNAEKREQEYIQTAEELQSGVGVEKGIETLKASIDSLSYNKSLLGMEDKVSYLRNNRSRYLQSVSDLLDEQQQVNELRNSIATDIKRISNTWTEQHVTGFTNLPSHRSKISSCKQEFEQLAIDKRDIANERNNRRLNESVLHAKRLVVAISLVLLASAVPTFFYGLSVWGIVLMVSAAIIFFGRDLFLRKERMQELHQRLVDNDKEERGLRERYHKFLEQLELPPALMPEDVMEVFGSLDIINKKIIDRERLQAKINTQRLPFIKEYETITTNFSNVLDKPFAASRAEIRAEQIITAFELSKETSLNKERLQQELNRKQAALKRLEEKLETVQTEISALLAYAGTDNRIEFRRLIEENQKVKSLTEKKNNAIEFIEQLAGRNNSEKVIDYLRHHEKASLEAQVRTLANDLTIKTQEWQTLNKELAQHKAERRRMEGASELAEVLTEVETEKQKLQHAYKQWITGKLALDILAKVRSHYEHERQPEVIKKASHYFAGITDNRYNRIQVSLDTRDVSIFNKQEASKQIWQLSRGTKEQLLISLRLGFIEEYESQAEPLPLIVDEVLVNFDPDRAKETAALLQSFAEKRQVFIFTCHPNVADFFHVASKLLLPSQTQK